VHHVGILYDQFMMHGQRNIKLYWVCLLLHFEDFTNSVCCPLDGLPTHCRASLLVGLPPWCR